MAKNWIKKAIKHPGRCTPGSPNYDCPKGSPQWNLAQRFKHGDLHKKEHGGMAASDNVDMGYYSNPLKYFAENGINLDETFSNRYVLSIQEFKNVVPDYQYEGYINSGIEGKYKNIDKTKYPVLVDKLQDGTITYRPYTIENAEKSDTTFNEVQKFSNGGYISTQDYANMQKVQAEQSVNNFNQFLQNNELGYDNPQVDLQGNPIQQKRSNPFEFQERKFESIGAPGSVGDKIQKAFSVMQAGSDAILKSVNPGQMASDGKIQRKSNYADFGMNLNNSLYPINQQNYSTNLIDPMQPIGFDMSQNKDNAMLNMQKNADPYANMQGLGDIGKGLEKMTPDLQGMQNIVPKSENYMEGLTNSNKYLDYDASNAKVGLENMKARIAGSSNPADAILGRVNMAGDLINSTLSAFAKPGSKASAYAEGSAKAQSIVKKIPIVGRASKLISGIIGGALGARRQGIENEEQDKMDKQTQYLSRNTQTAQQPSYYGQYMSKYGSNIKNLEQRLIDDIFSDYDKFMKLT